MSTTEADTPSSSGGRGFLWWIRESALTVGALLGVGCVVFAIVAAILGLQPLIFRSGSMAPTIDTGSLAISRTVPADSLQVGDIVSVTDSTGNRITHRVSAIAGHTGNSTTLLLRGDANRDADTESYTVTSAQRVLGHLPIAGYVAAWLTTPAALLLVALVIAGILWGTFRPRPRRRSTHRRDIPTRTSRRRPLDGRRPGSDPLAWTVGTIASVAAASFVVGASTHSTLAAFTDTATATARFSAASGDSSLPEIRCSGGGSSITLSWIPSTDTSVEYAIVVRKQGSDTTWHTYNPTSNRDSQVATTLDLEIGSFLVDSGTLIFELHTLISGTISQTYSAFSGDYSDRPEPSIVCGSRQAGESPAPASTPSPSSPMSGQPGGSSTPAPSTDTSPEPTSPAAPPAGDSPSQSPVTTSPAEQPAAPTTSTETPDDEPLGQRVISGTGYGAQVVQAAADGTVRVVISDASGAALADLPGTTADVLTWDGGDLWINRSGSYYRVSGSGSSWTATEVPASDVPASVTG
ncbi:hypothetical protein GCM10009624_05400 [Gordonia sinesedis]